MCSQGQVHLGNSAFQGKCVRRFLGWLSSGSHSLEGKPHCGLKCRPGIIGSKTDSEGVWVLMSLALVCLRLV